MSKSKWQEYKEKNGVTPLDILNPRTKPAFEEVANKGDGMFKSCPEFIKITKQSKQCGSFMAAKTKLESAKCPLGKW